MTDPVFELDNLTVRFGSRAILKGLSGAFRGRSIGLLGPNGAGKTTLLNTMLGFYPAEAGTVRVLGRDVRLHAKEVRRLVGYMPENDCFIAGMTAVRFLTLMAELTGIPRAHALERAHEALFYVGLGEARYRTIETFSQGMRQLVKLAQAIVHGPKLIILDEPTNALDPPARQRMIRLIQQIGSTRDVSVILSSHLLRDVEECCEDVLILKQGEIAASCNLDEERKVNRKFVQLEIRGDGGSFIDRLEKAGCEWAQSGAFRYRMVLPETVGMRQLYKAAAESRVQLRKVSYKRDTLEEIFLKAMET